MRFPHRRKQKLLGSSQADAPPPVPSADENSAPAEAVERPSPESESAEQDAPFLHMSLGDHLAELRTRLLRCVMGLLVGVLAVFSFAPKIRALMEGTVAAVLPPEGSMTFADFTEPFMVDMRIALVLGCFLTSPFIFYQIWAFIAPGLYVSERRYVIPVALASAFFFLTGGLFCYLVVIPFSVSFFIEYGFQAGGAKPLITIANTYSFMLRLIFVFGCMFEMPLFSFFLARFRVLTAMRLRLWRKYAILIIFIIAAIITPPDVVTQLLLAGPLIVLYELSILVAAVAAPKGREPEAAPAV